MLRAARRLRSPACPHMYLRSKSQAWAYRPATAATETLLSAEPSADATDNHLEAKFRPVAIHQTCEWCGDERTLALRYTSTPPPTAAIPEDVDACDSGDSLFIGLEPHCGTRPQRSSAGAASSTEEPPVTSTWFLGAFLNALDPWVRGSGSRESSLLHDVTRATIERYAQSVAAPQPGQPGQQQQQQPPVAGSVANFFSWTSWSRKEQQTEEEVERRGAPSPPAPSAASRGGAPRRATPPITPAEAARFAALAEAADFCRHWTKFEPLARQKQHARRPDGSACSCGSVHPDEQCQITLYEPDYDHVGSTYPLLHLQAPVASYLAALKYFGSAAKKVALDATVEALGQRLLRLEEGGASEPAAVDTAAALRAVRHAAAAYAAAYEHRFLDTGATLALVRAYPEIYQASYETNVGAAIRILNSDVAPAAHAAINHAVVAERAVPAAVEVRAARWTNLPWGLSYLISVDTAHEEITLAFRGTFSDAGIVVDCHNEPFPFFSAAEEAAWRAGDGSALGDKFRFTGPFGFVYPLVPGLSQVQHIDEELFAAALDPRYRGYRIVITGHSLGASNAINFVATRLLSSLHYASPSAAAAGAVDCSDAASVARAFRLLAPRIHVQAFAPPPCLNHDARDALAHFFPETRFSCFVFESDVVFRAQVAGFRTMAAIAEQRVPSILGQATLAVGAVLQAEAVTQRVTSAVAPGVYEAVAKCREQLARRPPPLRGAAPPPSSAPDASNRYHNRHLLQNRLDTQYNYYVFPGRVLLLGRVDGESAGSPPRLVHVADPMHPYLVVPRLDRKGMCDHFLSNYGNALRDIHLGASKQ